VIYLVRHGETIWNEAGRQQGQLDSPLTAKGSAQAQAVGRTLRHILQGARGVLIESSSLGRARQTAFLIGAELGIHSNEIRTSPLLMEHKLGVWEGLTYAEIDHAVDVLGKEDLILMHTTSTYPAKYEQLNLRAIPTMADRYGVPVGYSGHETGIPTSVAAAALGACCVERHITMDRAMWGSDQAASLEPNGIGRLVRDIRLCEQSMGDGIKRVYEEEIPVMKKLRRVGAAV